MSGNSNLQKIVFTKSCIAKKNRFFGISFRKNETEHEEQMIIVMEYCDKGDLAQFFQSNQFPKDWSSRIKIMLQIAHGINKLHQKNILHRDIKSRNVLVKTSGKTNQGEEEFEIKLGDLGFAKMKNTSTTFSISNNIVGTLAWMAPGDLRETNLQILINT